MSLTRTARTRLAAWAVPWLLPVRESPDWQPPAAPRIAIVRSDRRLGNLLTITTLFEPLRAHWPDARIDVVAHAAFADILEADPLVARVIPVDRARLWRSATALRGVLRALRDARYDIAIDAAHSHMFSRTDAVLTRATAAPWRIGFARGDEARFGNRLVPVPADAGRAPRPRVYRALLTGCDIPADGADAATRLILTVDERAGAATWWGTPRGPRVVLHTGGRGAKRWPEEAFVAVAARCAAAGDDVVLACDPGERDALAGRAPRGVRVAPALPIRAFAALVGEAGVYIGGDAGPAHVAAALGIPRVLVFREDKAHEWSYGAHVRTVTAVPDGPPVDAVLAALAALRAERAA